MTRFRLIGELSLCLALTARACGLIKSLIDENYVVYGVVLCSLMKLYLPCLVPSHRHIRQPLSSPSCTRRCTVSFPPAQQRSTCFLPPASWSPAGLVKKTSLVLFRSSSLHPLLSSLHPNTTPQRCLTPPLASSALCLSLPVPTFQPLSHPPFSPEDLHVVDPHPSYRHASSLPRHLRPFDFCDSGNFSAVTTIDRPCLSSAGLGGDLAGCNDAAAAPTQR